MLLKVLANNSQGIGKAVKVTGTTWPLPPIPKIVETRNTSLMIHIPLGDIYQPLVNLSLIVSFYAKIYVHQKNTQLFLIIGERN